MLLLPTVIIAMSTISGAGGLALSVKSVMDSLDASATTRQTQYQNEKNILRLEAVSEKLETSLGSLGRQRMVITKNFSVFVNAFEKIHNRPEFTKAEDVDFPQFDFDEIKNVSIVADAFFGATLGAVGGSVFAAVAASGTTAAVMAWGTASTGTKIAALHGAAATRAALAALGGGAISAGGGGMALGTLVLNVASLGVGVLVEGIAMAYAGSVARKQADEAHQQMLNNERIINKAIDTQVSISGAVTDMKRASVDICNNVYKPLVMELRDLVSRKQEWNDFTADEKLLVENCILIVQILHFLNNTPLYKATRFNSKGEVEEVEPNKEVRSAIKKAKAKASAIGR
ncbi:MAG: hypothetical protein IKG18_01925 [Atopobiaceae bacterium]|nr:hypothetical protein [Atopobiaceae bacterium]